jgi:hypothetical protein
MKLKSDLLGIAGAALIVFIFQSAGAQYNYKPGYIIKQSGDTVRGFIDHKTRGNYNGIISFRENSDGGNVFYTPMDIRCFGVLDEIFESAVIETEVSPSGTQNLKPEAELDLRRDTAFLQALVIGKKSLYHYINDYGNSQFYIKPDAAFQLLAYKRYIRRVDLEDASLQTSEKKIFENRLYIGQLMVYLDDCPGVKTEIEKTKYTRISLENLFSFYYKCTQSDVSYQGRTERTKAEFGITAGLSFTSAEFNGSAYLYMVETAFHTSTNATAGLALNLIMPGTRSRLSLYNELALSSYKTDGNYTDFSHENRYTVTKAGIGYSYLKMINMVRYTYPVNHLSFFINAGISNGIGFNETNYLYQEITFYNSFRTEEGKALDDTRKMEYGYIFGAGAKFKKYSLEYRYEVGNGMSDYVNLGAKVKRSFFLLGYTF